jgi:hypothetical protein
MKKLILFSLLLMILCVPALGQKKTENQKPVCALGLNQAPELRGFRMGMTPAAALARLPGVTLEKPDKFGLARLRITIIDSTSLIKPSAKEKAAQADMTAGPNDGSAFVLDGARFPALKGVRKMQMRFIDGRLSYLQVAYDNNIKWDSIDQFVETISTTLKLPREWQAPAESDGGAQVKELRCEGFVITASTIGDYSDVNAGPELILQDLAAWDALSKRQTDITEKAKREEDEKRKAFKP